MGGGAIRTAAKAAALAGARRPTFSPATAAATTVHVSSTGETQPSVSIFSSEKEKLVPAGNQWPAWDLNDWELAGEKEEESLLVSDPPPRVVFGSVPTLEEAMEATSDLKDALEKVYFSPLVDEAPVKVSKVSEPAGSQAILPVIPKHVVQAFSLLQGSPQAQNVVASLASDQNVWEAVMKNEKVIDFYKNHQSVLPPETNSSLDEFARESSGSVESPLKEKTPEGSIFTGLVQNIKVKVSEMVGSISDFLQDFMGTSSETNGETNTKTSTSTSNGHFGSTFIALAVACILVVLLKRG